MKIFDRFPPAPQLGLLSALALSAALLFTACDQSEADESTEPSPADASVSDKAVDAKPIAVDAKNFEATVLKSDKLVLVDYWAEWCGPCKVVAPAVDEIAKDYGDRVVVAKLDVDVAGDIATKYGVRTLPTLMLFKDGKVVGTVPMKGLPTKADIAAALEKHLK